MPMVNSREQERLKAFKNKGKDCEELRRRRNEVSVELRKNKREDVLSKRRNVREDDIDDLPLSPEKNEGRASEGPTVLPDLETIRDGIMSDQPELNFSCAQAARKILSREKNPPINNMISLGVLPRLVSFLDRFDSPMLQFESTWALTNIASGTSDQTNAVVRAGAVPGLVKLLASSELMVSEQAIWALGNIAGDGPPLRDLVIGQGILKPLLEIGRRAITSEDSTSYTEAFVRNLTWTISNLCRNKNPSPAIEVVRAVLPVLKGLADFQDFDVLADTCWALSYLTDGNDERIQEVVDSGVVPRLVQLMDCGNSPVVTPALRSLGNIVTGSDPLTDAVIAAGALPVFVQLLGNSKSNVVKEASWALSNITAGTPEQIQKAIDAGCLPALTHVLINGDFKAKKEAAWAVTNLTSGGTIHQIVALCAVGALKPMCDLLTANDEKLVGVLLEGIYNILDAAKREGEAANVCSAIEECGGLDLIESLQEHENELVYRKALRLIETFFSEEDDGELDPGTEQNEFRFQEPVVAGNADQISF